MEIVSRFTVAGKNAYIIKEDHMEYAATELGLYDVATLEGLKESGYKILGYYGNILMPSGICIKDLVESPCTLPESQIDIALTMEDSALTEAEAAPYFDRQVQIREVKTKEPVVEIHTRDELIAYLIKAHSSRKTKYFERDIRPLNSFVAKEALFTIDEVVNDSYIRRLMGLVEERRKLCSYNDYRRLIAFLQNEGVLGKEYTEDDVKAAYLSWGLCGLNTPIVESSVQVGVSVSIDTLVETMDAQNSMARQRIEKCIVDRQGKIYYSGGVLDATHYTATKFEGCPVMPINYEEFMKLMEKTAIWDTDCKYIECLVRVQTTRHYYTLMDESGVTYKAKVDIGRMLIRDSRAIVLNAGYLTVVGYDGEETTLKKCINEEEYAIWQLAKCKARELVRARTVEVPCQSSFELCLNEGVSPEKSMNWIARRIHENFNMNSFADKTIDYTDACTYYRNGPSPKLIKRYNPDNEEYETLDELIEIMLNTRSEMIEKNTYLNVTESDFSEDGIASRDELLLRPLEKLEFAKSVVSGELSIDYLRSGKLADGQAEYEELTQLLVSVLNYMSVKDSEVAKNVLGAIESTNVFDVDTAFKRRDAAYKGYMRDRAILNGTRAMECNHAVMITRVYREISNAPIKEQRHYIFDCMEINFTSSKAKKLRESFVESVHAAIEAGGFSFEDRQWMKAEAPAIAVGLMFKIITKQAKEAGSLYGAQLLVERVGDYDLQISIPEGTYRLAKQNDWFFTNKCCTLYEWCTYEMTPRFKWQFYCINANITPWEVKPKAGVKLPVYNYQVNYMDDATFERLSEGYRTSVVSTNARVRAFAKEYNSYALLPPSAAELNIYSDDTIDSVLPYEYDETAENYTKRYMTHAREAKEAGNYIYKFLLKSDYVYGNYYDCCCKLPKVAEIEYAPLEDPQQAKVWLTEISVNRLSDKSQVLGIEVVENGYGAFNIKEQPFSDICRWDAILRDTFRPNAEVKCREYRMLCVNKNGKAEIDLRTVAKDRIDKLVLKGIAYQIGARMYLFNTVDGYYFVEVR